MDIYALIVQNHMWPYAHPLNCGVPAAGLGLSMATLVILSLWLAIYFTLGHSHFSPINFIGVFHGGTRGKRKVGTHPLLGFSIDREKFPANSERTFDDT